MFRTLFASVIALSLTYPLPAVDPDFRDFVSAQAIALRANDKPPATLVEWQKQRGQLREKLLASWGGFPEVPCPLDVQKHGELKRDGYTLEKISFQTMPGVRMTANVYVPEKKGKLPAILQVHGHWKGAKQDPVVQARCIGAAKLGFFVLCVDAFGAGERGIGKALGEYHGEMVGALLYPIGKPLSGIQVYENMRAVDYLQTRPEVNGAKIGITGASGGGNQSMYSGAWDERLSAAVPVCSVGNYQAYLRTACCLCEVVPGALSYTEEWGVLSLTAPRGLMVVSATKDAYQFSVEQAKKSISQAMPVFELTGKKANLRHAIFESGHDYNQAMREAMYGFMTLHLKGEGDGSPIRDPEIRPEAPEDIRCFPGTTRADNWLTLPKFAALEGTKILEQKVAPKTAAEWATTSETMRKILVNKVFGGFPDRPKLPKIVQIEAKIMRFAPEPGLMLTADLREYDPKKPVTILLNFQGRDVATKSELAKEVRNAGGNRITFDLRGMGIAGDTIGRAPDHNSAEWSLWLGRPLLGQWTFDVVRLLDYLEAIEGLPKDVTIIGDGPAGLVALAVGAIEPRVAKIAAVGSLGSYISDEPYVGQRLGLMAPGILRDIGDVAHLAALAAPKRVVIAGAVHGGGKAFSEAEMTAIYRPATNVWALLKATTELKISHAASAADVLKMLK